MIYDISMISSISSFKNISAVLPNPKVKFGIAASFCNAAAVNSNGTKTLLGNGVSKFFISV